MNTAIQKALDFLNSQFDQTKWQNGERLPSVQALAKTAFVRTSIMSTALATIEKEGRITIVKRKGIFAGNHAMVDNSMRVESCHPLKWKQVRVQLEQEILSGKFADDLLPGIHDLADRYGVSAPTIKKVLSQLVTDSVVTSNKTRFKITRISPKHRDNSILFIGKGESGKISVYNTQLHESIRSFESECFKNNFVLNKLILSDTQITNLEKLINQSGTHFGFIIWALPFLQICSLTAILDTLTKYQRPVAIFDETGEYDLPPRFARLHMMTCLTSAGMVSGRIAGRYLLERRHTALAYLASAPSLRWSQDRRAGLKKVFTDAGLANAISIHEYQRITTLTDDSKKTRLAIEKIHLQLVAMIPEHYGIFLPAISPQLLELPSQRQLLQNVNQFFESVFSDKKITAWIGENDFIALLALQFLNVNYPDSQIEVIGFDDVVIATEYGLTSYYFSPTILVQKTIAFLKNPKSEYYWNKKRIECEGIIMQRSSTGVLTV